MLLMQKKISVRLARYFEREIRGNLWEIECYLKGKTWKEVIEDAFRNQL